MARSTTIYSQHNWSIGEPITQEWMMHIENGLAAMSNDIVTELYTKDEISALLAPISSNAETAVSTARAANSTANTALSNSSYGQEALSQITASCKGLNASKQEITYGNLASRLGGERDMLLNEISKVDTKAGNAASTLATLKTEVEEARGMLQWQSVGTANQLKDKINDLNYQIGQNKTTAEQARDSISDAKGQYNNLQDRLDKLDGGTVRATVLSNDFATLKSEVETARGSSGNVANTSLSMRFEQDETAILARVPINDIQPNLISTDDTKPLSANQGRILNEKISTLTTAINTQLGAEYTDQHTVTQAINTAEQNAKNYADTNKVDKSNIFDGLNYEPAANATDEKVLNAKQGKVLNDRLALVENALDEALVSSVIRTPGENAGDPDTNTTYSSLDDRLEAIESHKKLIQDEIAAAHISDAKGIVVNNELVPHTYNSLDARFEAIETDIDTIATDLNMYNTQTHAIENTNSRVDVIEENVVAMAKEIGMLQDESSVIDLSTAVDRNNTRIDTLSTDIGDISTEINNAHRTLTEGTDTLENRFEDIEERLDAIDTPSTGALAGLDDRIDTLETIITEENTGLVDRVDAIDNSSTGALKGIQDRLDNLDDVNNNNSLVNKVTALQSKQTSYTEVVAQLPSTNIDATKDYLVGPDSEGKYYYYKYINNAWELISGGSSSGGGGSGVEPVIVGSSAVIAETLPALADADTNTDYYIGTRTTGYIHYRYITVHNDATNLDVITPIIIGGPKYNITTAKENDTTYLYLFKFAQNEDSTLTDETDLDPLIQANKLVRKVPLPEGGGGGGSSETTSSYSAITRQIGDVERMISTADTNEVLIKLFFQAYQTQDGDNVKKNGDFILKRGGLVIDSGKIYSANLDITQDSPNYEQSFWTYNIGPHCVKGENHFVLTVTVGDLPPRIREWDIEVIELSLDSDVDINTTYTINQSLPINITVGGDSSTARTIYALIDGRTESNAITATIPAGDNTDTVTLTVPGDYLTTAGAHNIELYFKQIIGANENPSTSNHISYDITCIDSANDNIAIITSPYRLNGIDMKQYESLRIPYHIYIPSSITDQTYIKITNSITGKTLREPISNGSFSYLFKALEKGSQTITFDCVIVGTVNESTQDISLLAAPMLINATIGNSKYTINPITGTNLIFDFNPALGYSNDVTNEADKLWSYNYINGNTNITYHLTDTPGFDWENGGWKVDENDIPYFCIKAGSRASIDTSLFTGITETSGAEFKCIFKAVNVRNPEAIFLTSVDGTKSLITNYDSDISAGDQDVTKSKTLLSSYINVKEGHVISINTKKDPSDNEYMTDKLDVTVLPNNNDVNFDSFDSLLQAALNKRFKKNTSTQIANIKAIRDATDTDTKAVLNKLFSNDILSWYAAADTKTVDDRTVLYYTKVKQNDLKQKLALMANPLDTNLVIQDYYNNGTPTNAPQSTIEITAEERALLADFAWVKENGEYIYDEFDKHVTTDEYQALYDYELDGGLKKELLFEFYSETIVKENFPTNSITDINHLISDRNNIETRLISYRPVGATKDKEVEIEITYTTTTENDVITKHYQQINLIRPIVERIEQGRGLELRAHRSNLYLDNGTLTYPYSEEDIIEFEYNIYPVTDNKYTSCILTYEDGVPSASILYPKGVNAVVQTTPENLQLGSDDCDIHIYRMKFYNRKLENDEILQNFYADALDPTDMTARYERNRNTYITDKQPDTITPQSIAAACPDLRVIMIETPMLTEGKNSFIKNTSVRCIYKNGRPEDNWIAYNAYHAGQGTSSDAYGAAGRNLDIIFGFDGIDSVIAPKAKNNYRFDSEYKSILVTGVTDTSNSIPSLDTQYLDPIVTQINNNKAAGAADITKNDLVNGDYYPENTDYYPYDNQKIYFKGQGKINLTDESVPNNWFNIKLNIASSENTNNALLQKRFDRYLPYRDQVPAMRRDPYVKNSMEFFNTIVFIRETSANRNEFNDDAWHFYGIGNLGDSKKTDNTRVNIPLDPAEFCVEISDNGLINSGFSTGVYYDTQADADAEKTYSQVSQVSFTNKGYGTIYPISEALWDNENNVARTTVTNYAEGGGWEKSFEFRYDISTKDGNTISNNDVAKALAKRRQERNKAKFAAMYKWVATSTDKNFHDTLQNWFIKDAPLYWYLFTERYTMIDSRAKNTFWHYGKIYLTDAEYLVQNNGKTAAVEAAEALVTAKTNAYNALLEDENATASDLNEAQLDLLEAQNDLEIAQYIQQNRENFMHNKYTNGVGTPLKDRYSNDLDCNALGQINNGYRFELWDYDNDTALGINNNGKMVFDAGLEDIDKLANSWVYNEGPSVFWRRIRKNMTSELATLYTDLKGECFNAKNLIDEFDKWQEQFPENLWRLDFERKYYRPYNVGGEVSYLRDMANGRKKYQRREFENNMCIYINSKYLPTAAYDPTDFIHFRPVNPQNVYQSRKIYIKPYSAMYINISIGNDENSARTSERTMAGETREFDISGAISSVVDLQNIQCKIYNASRIMEITGLENYYPDQIALAAGKKLRKITLGADYVHDENGEIIYVDGSGERVENPENGTPLAYTNTNTKVLELGISESTNPVLEELDIRNCQALTGTFNLAGCISLTKLLAQGTQISYFILPNGGLVRELHLPSTTTTLNFQNLKLLTTLDLLSYANVNSLTVNNTPNIDILSIINSTINNLTYININKISWLNLNNLDLLKAIYDKRKVAENPEDFMLDGFIKLSENATYRTLELADYRAAWSPGLVIDVSLAREIKQYSVTFRYDSATIAADNIPEKKQQIFQYYVLADENNNATLTYYDGTRYRGLDPVALGWITGADIPSRKQTDEFTYTFGTYAGTTYNMFSGWITDSGEVPTTATTFKRNITLYTKFIETPRTYAFRWYTKNITGDKILVKTSDNINYGQNSVASAPTVPEMIEQGYSVLLSSSTNNIISIFKGWDHLPLNISPANQDIDALWETYNLDAINFGNNINLSNLSAGELYYLCNNAAQLSKINTNDRMEIQLGYTGIDTPDVVLTAPNANNEESELIVLHDSNQDYYPYANLRLLEEDTEFTMAIDYRFNIDNSPNLSNANYAGYTPHRQSILLSCYRDDSSSINGFKLYYDLTDQTSKISFGDSGTESHTVTLSGRTDAHNRNIVVIRHPKNSASLYVAYGTNGNGMLDNVTETEITLPAFTPINMPLVIGACLNPTNGNQPYSDLVNRPYGFGSGTIYKVRIWNKDVGSGEAKALANWCQEKMTFGVVETTRTANSVLNIPDDKKSSYQPNMYLSSLSVSEMSRYTITGVSNATTGNAVGWFNTPYRTMLNQRIFNALPIELQVILHPIVVRTNRAIYTSDFNPHYAVGEGNAIELNGEYINIPSYVELAGIIDTYRGEALSKYPWILASQTTLKAYNGSGFDTIDKTDKYMNVRCQGIPINLTPHIYQINIENIINTSAYNIITNQNQPLVSGDMWDDNGAVYIYADSSQVNAGAPVIYATSNYNPKFACASGGGWIPAVEWWTRSFIDSENIWQGDPNFAFVHTNGILETGKEAVNTLSKYIDYSIGF